MARIRAENACLTFPLYASAKRRGLADSEVQRGRLIRGRNGEIRAVKALDKISFRIEEGERVGLIGANGSGKTSLLHLLAGIYPPDSGRIIMDGRTTSLININLGMDLEANGHRNVTLRGLAAGYSREEIEARRDDIASFCELGDFLSMPIETYSAGMRMRLNFAIATAFDPEILLLDEWLSAGDAAFKRKASERMNDFVAKAGVVVLATHSRDLLMKNCTRAMWIDAGAIRADGPVQDVFELYEAQSKD